MSKHSSRHRKARTIRAAAKQGPILTEAVGIEWIIAADDDDEAANKPKRFKMRAYNGGPMQVNNYGPPVVIDMAGLTAKAPVPILRDHDVSRVVGHADEVVIGESTLDLAGLVSGAGLDAKEVVDSSANGFPWKGSVGARPDKLEFVGEGVSTKCNGKTFTGPLYVARKSTLGETSFVAIGADKKTSVKVAASAAQPKETDMKFEQWIEAMGLDMAELREDQIAKLRANYDKIEAAAAKTGKDIEGKAAPPVVEAPTFDIQAIDLAYARQETAIEATAEEFRSDVPEADWDRLTTAARKAAIEAKATALKDEWPGPRLEAEYVKAAAIFKADMMVVRRPKGPAIHSSSRDFSLPAIEAAFCKSAGMTGLEKQFKPEVLEAADSHYNNLGLQELLLICAMQNGYAGRMRVGRDNLRDVIRAAFSTHTISTLLTTTGNKLLLEGFNLIPQSWREVAGIRPVSDFKAVTAFRLTASLEYEEVGPSGKIKHGSAGQDTYTLQAKTYAKMFALTRQDIVNDDLGAFNDLRNRLGLGANIAMNKVFWTCWLAASNAGTYWTAARGNYQSGAATVLGEAGLNTAVKLFRDAKGPDGNLLGVEPSKLLVPSDLEAPGRKLYVSQEMRDTTASTKTMTSNIYFNRFRPVVVPELSSSAYTGYSATAWWLLCDPALLASAIMCFLNGQQAPTIETTDADFDTLGIQSRGWHDFGVSMAEYRASVHSAGA